MLKTPLFGIDYNVGSYNSMIDAFTQAAKKGKSKYALFVNSHMLYEFYHLSEFKEVVQQAAWCCPDGVPLLNSLRWFRKVQTDRIAGNDVMPSMIEACGENDLSLFLLGTNSDVIDRIINRAKTRFPTLKAAGYAPPYQPIEEFDFEQQSKLINEFKPNVILVGLGCPKQEIWMHRMSKQVSGVMFGVGGAFLLYAGIDSRAPKWMRDLGLEWIYRLALEPKRLMKRYFVTNSFFCYLFFKELIKKLSNRKE